MMIALIAFDAAACLGLLRSKALNPSGDRVVLVKSGLLGERAFEKDNV